MKKDDIRIYPNGVIATTLELTSAEQTTVDCIANVACVKAKEEDRQQIALYLKLDLAEHFDVLNSENRFTTWVHQKKIEFKRVYGAELDEVELFRRFDAYKRLSATPRNKEIIDKYNGWKRRNEKELEKVKADHSLKPSEKEAKIASIQETLKNLDQGLNRFMDSMFGRMR